MKKIFSFFVLTLAFGAAACNTVEGAGRDLQSAGDAVEDAAN